MEIVINGDIYITQYGEKLGISQTDECEITQDVDIKYDDDDIGVADAIDYVVDIYSELIEEECPCKDCTSEILLNFLEDVVSFGKLFI